MTLRDIDWVLYFFFFFFSFTFFIFFIFFCVVYLAGVFDIRKVAFCILEGLGS